MSVCKERILFPNAVLPRRSRNYHLDKWEQDGLLMYRITGDGAEKGPIIQNALIELGKRKTPKSRVLTGFDYSKYCDEEHPYKRKRMVEEAGQSEGPVSYETHDIEEINTIVAELRNRGAREDRTQ